MVSYLQLVSKPLQHLIQRFAKLLKMVIILFVVSRPRHVWWNRISLLRSRLPQIVSLLYTPFLLGEGEFKYCPLGFNHVGNVNKWINVFLNLVRVALDLPLVELWKPSTERKKSRLSRDSRMWRGRLKRNVISCNRQTNLIKSYGVYASKAPFISRTIVLGRALPSQPASQLERAFVWEKKITTPLPEPLAFALWLPCLSWPA